MDHLHQSLIEAHALYHRAENTTANATTSSSTDPEHRERPPVFKLVGIALAVASGVFIGISFVVKKAGLLRANAKYHEEAGEGYGYLKNWLWWTGMTLMIVGEICNFVAYAFVDAILVTPLGALSVVITTVLSAIFLKERLSLVGKIGCFLCIVGSVVILMNAPEEASAATIQQMRRFVIAPGFLSYAGVVLLGCLFAAWWAAPRYGKKSMLVYISICSWIGGLSVVATQGLGAAIVTQIGGTPQFNQWFLYVLLVFVIATLVTEVVYLNKALNIFNAALVTPTYYVYFTSTTIITSAILFRGFKGTASSIITMVLGFLTICSGVVLLQLSKSAKDVPDAAVFSGDLDQVRTIAEQEQPESEPKADAIRGAAAIVRRLSTARQKMEMAEARRLHEEKLMDLQPIQEGEQIEWDGLRRRRTTMHSMRSARSARSGPSTAWTDESSIRPISRTTTVSRASNWHPPLGMSRFPDYDEDAATLDVESRPDSSNSFGAALLGTIRGARMKSSPQTTTTRPVQLADMDTSYPSQTVSHLGLPAALAKVPSYAGQGGSRHVVFADGADHESPPPPPIQAAKRQFSFAFLRKSSSGSGSRDGAQEPMREVAGRGHARQRSADLRRRARNTATEEERLGLVHGDGASGVEGHVEDGDEDEDRDGSDGEDDDDEHEMDPRHRLSGVHSGGVYSAVDDDLDRPGRQGFAEEARYHDPGIIPADEKRRQRRNAPDSLGDERRHAPANTSIRPHASPRRRPEDTVPQQQDAQRPPRHTHTHTHTLDRRISSTDGSISSGWRDSETGVGAQAGVGAHAGAERTQHGHAGHAANDDFDDDHDHDDDDDDDDDRHNAVDSKRAPARGGAFI